MGARDRLVLEIEQALAAYAADPDNRTPNPSSVWITAAANIAVDVLRYPGIETTDARTWAREFVARFDQAYVCGNPECLANHEDGTVDEDEMVGWFGNLTEAVKATAERTTAVVTTRSLVITDVRQCTHGTPGTYCTECLERRQAEYSEPLDVGERLQLVRDD